jgi:hypothetical protein
MNEPTFKRDFTKYVVKDVAFEIVFAGAIAIVLANIIMKHLPQTLV